MVFRILTLCLLLSLPALADSTITPIHGDTWEMYVLGGASVFFDIFTGLKMFTDSSAFSSLALFVASLSFLVLMIKNTSQLDPKSLTMFFIAIFGASYMTFTAKIDLTIIDSVGLDRGAVDSTRIVTGVPASVGLPAAWISEIGEVFLEKIEFFFSIPSGDYENLKFQNTRTLNMEAKLIQDALTIHPFPPTLTKSLGNFYKDCVFPLIAVGDLNIDVLMQSPNMSSLIEANLNPALSTMVYTAATPHGEMLNCEDAWTSEATVYNASGSTIPACSASGCTGSDLKKGFKHQIDHYTYNVITPRYTFNKSMTDIDASATQSTDMGGLVNAILSNVSNASDTTSASDIVKNRSLARSFNAGLLSGGAAAGYGSESLPGFLIEEQTTAQQTEGWRMAIIAFNNMAGYIYIVLHAFIIAISPLILVLLFLPGIASKMVLNYLQVLFWLALWQPMMALVNFIIRSFQNNELAALYRKSTSDFVAAGSPEMWRPTSEILDKYTLAAGFLGTMIPMISWGLVKGGMAFSQFIASGIGTSVAQGAAKNLATGSLSMDSMSFNSRSGNSFNTVDQIATGQAPPEYGYLSYGSGTQTTGYLSDRGTTKGGDKKAVDYAAMNESAKQQALSAGIDLSKAQSQTGQQVWSHLAAGMQTKMEAWQEAKAGGTNKTVTQTLDELNKYTDAVTKIFGQDAGREMRNQISQQVQGNGALAAIQSLVKRAHTDDDFMEKMQNGQTSVQDYKDTLSQQWENEGEDGAMHLAAQASGLEKEDYISQQAETFKKLENIDINDTSQVEFTAGKNILGQAVSGLAQTWAGSGVIPGGEGLKGLIKSITPTAELTTNDVLSFTNAIAMKEVDQNGSTADQTTQVGERVADGQTWMKNFTNSELFSSADSVTDSKGKTLTQSVQETLNDTAGYKEAVTNIEKITSSFSDKQNLTPTEYRDLRASTERISKPYSGFAQQNMDGSQVDASRAPSNLHNSVDRNNLENIESPAVDTTATNDVEPTVTGQSGFVKKVEGQSDDTLNTTGMIKRKKDETDDEFSQRKEDFITSRAFTSLGLSSFENSDTAQLMKADANWHGKEFLAKLAGAPEEQIQQGSAFINAIDGKGSTVAQIENPVTAGGGLTANEIQFSNNGGILKDAIEGEFVYTSESGDKFMKDNDGNYQQVIRDGNSYRPIESGEGNQIQYQSEQGTVTLDEYGRDKDGNTLYSNSSKDGELIKYSDAEAERLDADGVWKKEQIEQRELDNQRRTQELKQAQAMVPGLDSLAELGSPEAKESLSKLAIQMASGTDSDRVTLREWADNNANSNPSMADAAYEALNVEPPGQMSSASIEDKLTNLEGAKTAGDFVPIAQELANGTDSDREALQEWIDNEGRNHQHRDIAQNSINYYHEQNGGNNG